MKLACERTGFSPKDEKKPIPTDVAPYGLDTGISRHLKDIFETSELQRDATVANFATVQEEGERKIIRELEYFNLEAIIAVGYRINSHRGTQFRTWATNQLADFKTVATHLEPILRSVTMCSALR